VNTHSASKTLKPPRQQAVSDNEILLIILPSILSFIGLMYSQKAAKNSQDMDKIREDVAWLKGKLSEHLRDHP
jgi:hypothetical protein